MGNDVGVIQGSLAPPFLSRGEDGNRDDRGPPGTLPPRTPTQKTLRARRGVHVREERPSILRSFGKGEERESLSKTLCFGARVSATSPTQGSCFGRRARVYRPVYCLRAALPRRHRLSSRVLPISFGGSQTPSRNREKPLGGWDETQGTFSPRPSPDVRGAKAGADINVKKN